MGCNVKKSNGMNCAKASCDHKQRTTSAMYRFQIQLTDRSPSPPLTVTIFYQAKNLIGISAEQLARRSHEAQRALVRERTSVKESCIVSINVKEDSFSGHFVTIVQYFFSVDIEDDEVLRDLMVWMGTLGPSPGLGKSPGDVHTPRGEDSSVGESSSQRRGRGSSLRSSQLSSVKTKLQDLIEIIDLGED